MRSLIICIGNPMRSDDGLGFRVWEELRARGVHAILSGPDLPPQITDFDRVILIDAIDFKAEPGSVFEGRIEDLDVLESRSSTHGLSPLSFLKIIKEVTGRPEEAILIGVQPKSLEEGEGLSEEVERAVSEVIDRVMRLIGLEDEA
jgi:hydrogenase maturation protease